MKIETLQTVLSFLQGQGITEIESLNIVKVDQWDFVIGPNYSMEIPATGNKLGKANLRRTIDIRLPEAELDSRDKGDIYLR